MKFQDKFYDIIHHNKCPSSEKSAEKCILRNSYFHHSEPSYDLFQDYNDGGSFWIDPAANTIKEFHTNELTNVGKAYMKPYHLDSYKPKHMV